MGKKFLVLFVYITILCCSILSEQIDILKKIDEIRAPAESFSFDLEIIVKTKNEQKISKYTVYVNSATKSLVKFTYPAEDKGKIMLMVGNDMWMYFPTTQNPIRISPQQRLLGDVSNADAARVVYSIDYEVITSTRELINNFELLKLTLKPKTKNAAYGEILLWVDTETYKPYKAEYYSSFQKLLKTVQYKEYQEILGNQRPTLLEIYSEFSKDKITLMKYSNFKLETLPDKYFRKEYLKYVK